MTAGPAGGPAPAPPASVIVVSRDRPAELLRCVTALMQLDHAPVELVIVACKAGYAALTGALPPGGRAGVKLVPYDTPNLSRGRNLGLRHAAATIVAFIDDDAVPEPTWLGRLIAPLSDPAVGAAGGFVLGRNGISLQWGARWADDAGQSHPLDVAPRQTAILSPAPGRWPRVEGTNCAFRRADLAALGGFDPAFRFYLDDTDLCLRLGKAGWQTAIVPDAIVHHGYAAGPHRRGDRAPRSLVELGASTAVFLRKHDPGGVEPGLAQLRAQQRRRLLAMMVDGTLAPTDIRPLIRGLERGVVLGRGRPLNGHPPVGAPLTPFVPLGRAEPLPRAILAGRTWAADALRRRAADLAARGIITTVFILSPTLQRHRAGFRLPGFWEQRGGVAGRSDRTAAWKLFLTLGQRVRRETARISGVRGPFDADSA